MIVKMARSLLCLLTILSVTGATSLFSAKCRRNTRILKCLASDGQILAHISGVSYDDIYVLKLIGRDDNIWIDVGLFPNLKVCTIVVSYVLHLLLCSKVYYMFYF